MGRTFRSGGRGIGGVRRALSVAVASFALALAGHSHLLAGEIARGDLNIAGMLLELDGRPVVTATGVGAGIQTIFGGAVNDAAAAAPGLSVYGELTGPGLDQPLTLITRPGAKFEIPALQVAGEYLLRNVRLVDASGGVLQLAIPSSAVVTVVDVLSTTVRVRQLSPDELRARGINLGSSFDCYEYTVTLAIDGKTVEIPYPVIVDRRTHEFISAPTPNPYSLPELKPGSPPPPRFQPPDTLPLMLADDPAAVPFTPSGDTPDPEKPLPPKPRIPAAIVIPNGFGVLHQFFSVLLQVSNGAPAGSEIRLDSVSAAIDAPLALRVAATKPAVAIGQPLPITDALTGATYLAPGGAGSGEWSLEGLKAGTHTVTIDVRATYRSPGQRDLPLRGSVSASLAISDPRFHITFSHPDTIRAGEPYTAYAFVTNLSSQRQTVRLDTSEIPQCGQGYLSDICRTSGSGVDELTIEPGADASVAYPLTSRIDGHVFATAGEASDESIGVGVKLTMGVSASGIPLSATTLVMPWYARYLDPAFVDAQLGLLGLGYSIATAPLTQSTASYPRVIRSDVFRRAQEIARAGQRLFIARRDASVSTPAESRAPVANLALDLLDNAERADLSESELPLREWDELRRREAAGHRAASAMARLLESSGLSDGRSLADFVDGFAAATAHRSPYLLALVHGPPVAGVARPYALSLTGTTGVLDVPSEAGSGWIRTLPFAELSSMHSAAEEGELALVGRWGDDVRVTLVPQSASFSLDLIYPDAAAGFLRAALAITGATPGFPVNVTISRGARSAALTGAVASPVIAPVALPPLAAVAAAQDLHLDPAGHVVSLLFNRPVRAAEGTQLADALSITTRIDSIGYSALRRNAPPSVPIPGASVQDDATIVDVSFDKALSRNAAYTLGYESLADPLGTAGATGTVDPRIDNDRPGGIVNGRVLAADGHELEGVPVQLVSGAPQYDTTVAHGRFLFEFVERDIDRGINGNYVLSATSDDKYTELRGAVRIPGQVQNVDLVFLGRGSASGTVRTSGGVPVTNASVVVSSPLFREFRQTTTDEAGHFSVADLPVGPLTFIATDPSGRTVYATNEIRTAGQSVTQDLVIEEQPPPGLATVRVTVRRSDVADPVKSLVANAHVGLYSRGFGLRDGLTDSSGTIEFDSVPAGFVSILASEFSLTRESAAIDLDVRADSLVDQTITLHVASAQDDASLVSLVGSVTRDDPGGPNDTARDQPVPGAVLAIPGLAPVTADADGRYEYPAVPQRLAGASMQVFDPGTGRRGAFEVPTLVSGANPFNVRLQSTHASGLARMRVHLADARGNPVSGYRVVSPHYPPIEFSESAPGVYELANVAVPVAYDVFAVPVDAHGPYGDQYARGTVRVDFDGQIGVAELRLPGSGTVTASFVIAGQNCDGVNCASGPLAVSYLAWDEVEQSATARVRRVDPDPATGRITIASLPALNDIGVETIDHPLGYARASTRLLFDGDAKNVVLQLSKSGELEGRVLMFDGRSPADAAVVRVEGSIANITPQTAKSDGGFRFAAVAADEDVRVIAELTRNGIYRTGFVDIHVPHDGSPLRGLSIVLREQSSIEGKILDEAGEPVPLAHYWVRELAWPYRTFGSERESLTADKAGHFAIGNVFAGAFRVTAESPVVQEERGEFTGTIRFEDDASQRNINVAIGSAGTGRIDVAVVDPLNAFGPVGGAEVMLVRDGTPFDFGTTDAGGVVVFDRVPAAGSYTIRAYAKALGRAGTVAAFSVAADSVVTENVALEIRGRVAGVVHDPESVPPEAPVIGAPVTLSGEASFATRASSDGSGAFEFVGVPEGVFDVVAREESSGRDSQHAGGTITKLFPERTGLTLELQRTAQLHVRAYLPDDHGAAGELAPLVDAVVTQGRNGSIYLRELQGNDLTFPRLNATEEFAVAVEELGGEGRHATVFGSFSGGVLEATVNVVFAASGSVTVNVVDAGGQPVSDARVAIAGGSKSATLFTGAGGSVSLSGFPLGTIVAQASKGSVAASKSGTLSSRTVPLVLTLNLGTTVSVVGSVVAEGSGGGVSVGTRVVLSASSPLLGGALTLETRTDAQGSYRFDAIPVSGTSITVSCLLPDEVTAGATIARSIPDGTTGVVDLGAVTLDGTPPRVVAIDPPNNANDVAPNSVVTVTLSEPVGPQFLTTGYFQLASTDDGAVIGNASITAAPLDGGGELLTITAPDPTPQQVAAGQKYRLKSNTLYRLTVSGSIADATGNTMGASVGATFTTVNYTEPAVVRVQPAVDVPLAEQTTFRVRFNKPIDATAFAVGGGGIARLDRLDARGGAPMTTVPVTVYRDPTDAQTLVIAPAGVAIAESSFYRLTVSGARDTQQPPNVQAAPAVFDYFSFDRKAPVVTIGSPVPDGVDLVSGVSYVVVPSIVDAGTQTPSTDVAYVNWLDGAGGFLTRATATPFSFVFTAPAAPSDVTITATARDLSGNDSPAPASRTWHVVPDAPPAALTLTTSVVESYPGRNIGAEASFTDEGLVVTVSLRLEALQRDGSTYSAFVGSTQVTRPTLVSPWPRAQFTTVLPLTLAAGTATLTAIATDAASHASSVTSTLTILADTTAPHVTASAPSPESRFRNGDLLTVSVSASDDETGIASATIAIGSGAAVTIGAGDAGSTFDGASGVWTFARTMTVPARNADTRTHVAIAVRDRAGNSATADRDVIFERVDDPAIPRAAWITPLDGALLPRNQSGWLTALRVRASGNVTQVIFSGAALAAPVTVTSPSPGTADVFETRQALTLPADGSATVLTATISDGVEAHTVELPIEVESVLPDVAVVSNDLAITAATAPSFAGKSLLLRGPNAHLLVHVPVTVGDLMLIDGASASAPDLQPADVTVRGRLFVDADSSIDVTEKGYSGAWRTRDDNSQNASASGKTKSGAGALGSGSHAGIGGASDNAPTNSTYGSIASPADFGAGGGGSQACCTGGGNGGGVLLLHGGANAGDAGRIVVAGSIRADGGSGSGRGGAGAGGSVAIDANALTTGAATHISANGGDDDASPSESRGGGGGRIALTARVRLDLADVAAAVEARGGRNGIDDEGATYTDGGAGTLFLRRPGAVNGELIVSSADPRHAASTHVTRGTPLAGALTFDAIDVGPRALARFDDPYDVPDGSAVHVDDSALLLTPADQPQLSISSNPSAGAILIQATPLTVTATAAAPDGIETVRLVPQFGSTDQALEPLHPTSVVAPLAVTVPADALPGATSALVTAVSRSGRSVSAPPLAFDIVANSAPAISGFVTTPADSLYAGHTIDVALSATDDYAVTALSLASSIGTVTANSAFPDPPPQSVTRQFAVSIPPTTPAGPLVLTASASDAFPGRAATTAGKTLTILADTNAPSITVLQPSVGQVFDEGVGATFLVEAQIADAETGVAHAAVTLDGVSADLIPELPGLYSASLVVPNVDGSAVIQKQLVVTAEDFGGNASSVPVTIGIQPFVNAKGLRIWLPANSVSQGDTIDAEVRLDDPAAEAATIQLTASSEAVTMPATVTIAAGAQSAAFGLTANGVTARETVTLTATFGVSSATAGVTVTPPPTVAEVIVPQLVLSGTSFSGEVVLTEPAPMAGTALQLTASDPAVVTIPASATVFAGMSTNGFPIEVADVASDTQVSITATLGASSASASFTIFVPRTIASLTVPATIAGGQSATGSVSLDHPAPPGGAVVEITSSLGDLSVTTPVTIAAGETAGEFQIHTIAVTSDETATITATFGSSTRSAQVVIAGPRNYLEITPEMTGGDDGFRARTIAIDGSSMALASRSDAGSSIGASDKVLLFDLTDPVAPAFVRRVATGSGAAIRDIALRGDALYVAAADGLWVIDLGQPSPLPQVVDPTPMRGIGASGTLLVTTTDHDLRTFTLADPFAPAPRDSVPLSDVYSQVLLRGSYAYLLAQTKVNGADILAYDLAASPPLRTSANNQSLPVRRGSIAGSKLYVAEAGGFAVLDLSTPSTPVGVAGFGSPFSGVSGRAIDADGAVVELSAPDQLRAFTVSSAGVVAGTSDPYVGWDVRFVAEAELLASDDRIYVLSDSRRGPSLNGDAIAFRINSDNSITVTGPSTAARGKAPLAIVGTAAGAQAAQTPLGSGAFSLRIAGQPGDAIAIFVRDADGRESTPLPLAQLPQGTYLPLDPVNAAAGFRARRLELVGDTLVVASRPDVHSAGSSNLLLYDVTTAAAPGFVGAIDGGAGAVNALASSGNALYVAGANGFSMLDLTRSPLTPVVPAQPAGSALAIAADSTYLFVMAHHADDDALYRDTYDLLTMTLLRSETQFLTGVASTRSDARAVTTAVVWSRNNHGFVLHDEFDELLGSVESSQAAPDSPSDLVADGPRAFVTSASALSSIDFETGEGFTLPTAEHLHGLAAAGQRLLVASEEGGLEDFDTSSGAFVLEGSRATGGRAWDVRLRSGIALVAAEDGLCIVSDLTLPPRIDRLRVSVTNGDAGAAVAGSARAIDAAPGALSAQADATAGAVAPLVVNSDGGFDATALAAAAGEAVSITASCSGGSSTQSVPSVPFARSIETFVLTSAIAGGDAQARLTHLQSDGGALFASGGNPWDSDLASSSIFAFDPAQPLQAQTPRILHAGSGGVRNFAAAGGWIYAAAGDFVTVDEATGESHSVSGHGGDLMAVAVAGGYAYATHEVHDGNGVSQTAIQVYDVANPASPQFVAEEVLQVGEAGHGLVAFGGHYLALFASFDGEHGVVFIDRSDPMNLAVVSTLPQYGLAEGVLDGPMLWAAGDFGVVTGIDVTDPMHPLLVSEIGLPPYAHDMTLSGPHELAVANGTSGVTFVDVTDPANPVVKGTQILDGSPAGVLLHGGKLYVASQRRLQSIAR